MKCIFFQAAVVSIQLYGCTTWTLTKRMEKKLDGNRMLRAILNKPWRQHPTRHQLYGHLPPITKTIQVRQTRHAGHCWRSGDELIRDVLLWTPTYGRAKAGWPAQTYIQQLCEDTGCSPEYLPEAMNDREKWKERVRDIRAGGTTWWWWWWHSHYSCIRHTHTHEYITNNIRTFFLPCCVFLLTYLVYKIICFMLSCCKFSFVHVIHFFVLYIVERLSKFCFKQNHERTNRLTRPPLKHHRQYHWIHEYTRISYFKLFFLSATS